MTFLLWIFPWEPSVTTAISLTQCACVCSLLGAVAACSGLWTSLVHSLTFADSWGLKDVEGGRKQKKSSGPTDDAHREASEQKKEQK
jgi:hypothetical protein